ncbi:MAG: helix-turn-helix transcriptional regulator [Bacilli bacterium]|nr:helix-turn-helix transcriptional regulator [Bacilli bacterium]
MSSNAILIGQRIRRIRKKKEVTQKQLAEILSLSNSTISHYENGSRNISLEDLTTICNYFEVDVDKILGLNRKGESANNKIKLSDDEVILILELRKTKSYENMISNPVNYAKLIEMKTSDYKSNI